MTFSQELADRVRRVAETSWTATADDVLAAVFHEAVGQYADLWIEELREDIRRAEEAADERWNHAFYKFSQSGEARS